MNEKLELLNGLQAELEGLGIKISRIAVYTRRCFDGDEIEETEVAEVTMPCQSGFYHAECVAAERGSYKITIVREIGTQIRGFESRLHETILSETVRNLDGPTLRRLLKDGVEKFSRPVMQDFVMVCANWPVAAEGGAK
ncbi:MAG: hypothetical protein IT204_02025 [Fimbriimonadaceae bacterium]|nr:hypothetical protein [Fimbriimonadaceae bacterium]